MHAATFACTAVPLAVTFRVHEGDARVHGGTA